MARENSTRNATGRSTGVVNRNTQRYYKKRSMSYLTQKASPKGTSHLCVYNWRVQAAPSMTDTWAPVKSDTRQMDASLLSTGPQQFMKALLIDPNHFA